MTKFFRYTGKRSHSVVWLLNLQIRLSKKIYQTATNSRNIQCLVKETIQRVTEIVLECWEASKKFKPLQPT